MKDLIIIVIFFSSVAWTQTTTPATSAGTPNFVDVLSNQSIGGNKIWSGTHVFNKAVSFPGGIAGTVGPVSLSSLNSSFLFADTFSGVDASCKITAAIAALPSAGGVVVAKNLSDAGGTGACAIDPGPRSVSIWLGPYNYKFSSVVWRSNLQIIGSGAAGNSNSTIISAINTTGALFTPGGSPSIATNIWLQGFRVYGPGITECTSAQHPTAVTDAFLFDASTDSRGIWYSQLHDVEVCNFSGVGLHAKGVPGVNQFNSFYNVDVFRACGGLPGMKIEGANYQFFFHNVQSDGCFGNSNIDKTTTNANVFIGGAAGGATGAYPFIIEFDGLTSQGALTAVQIDGGQQIHFRGAHHELVEGVYLITYGASGNNIPTDNVSISETSFNSNTGIGTPTPGLGVGSGYLLKSTTAHARGISFKNNAYLSPSGGPVPNYVIWSSDGCAQITAQDNEVSSIGTWNGILQAGKAQPKTQGVTCTRAAAAAIDVGNAHTVQLTSGAAVSNIVTTLLPGEYLVVEAANSVQFSTGGNINLGGPSSIFLNPGQTATFVRTDLAAHLWQLVALTEAADGGMAKWSRGTAGCATAGSMMAACDTTITWTTAFPDANYTPTCAGVGIASNVPLNGGIVSKTAGNIVFRTVAGTAAPAQYANISCTARHD